MILKAVRKSRTPLPNHQDVASLVYDTEERITRRYTSSGLELSGCIQFCNEAQFHNWVTQNSKFWTDMDEDLLVDEGL